MTKKSRTNAPSADREAQFDIAAHKKELDRLLRENAKLKAQKLTLERELELRPPMDFADHGRVDVEAFKAKLEKVRDQLLKPPPQTDTQQDYGREHEPRTSD